MAVTLEWVRDNYDANKNRRIEDSERDTAEVDWKSGKITMDEFVAVMNACSEQVLLPEYGLPPSAITCNSKTPHHSSGCALLKHYDADSDGIISDSELFSARRDRDDTRMGKVDLLTSEEYYFVHAATGVVSINALCPGCTPTPTPPVCTPYEKRCYNGNTVETCNYNGTVWNRQTCPSGYTCVNGECVKTSEPIPVCTPGEKVCTGATTRKVCKVGGDGWTYSSCPSGYECKNGECVPISSPPPTEITCNGSTPHFSSGCAMLNQYDSSGDGTISMSELGTAITHKNNGVITADEFTFIEAAWKAGSINALCAGCYSTTAPVCIPGAKRCRDANTVEQCRADGSGFDVVQTCGTGYECKNGECVPTSTPTPPGMETRTVSLTERTHTIQVSLNGYDTLNATIDVTATGVTCVSVVPGDCGGSGLPRVSTSGWVVSTYLKSTTTTTTKCTWIATQNTSSVAFISDMVLAYNNLKNIGFTPSAAEIGDGVLMYSNLGTPASLWGC